MSYTVLDGIVIGAGHAGLSISYYLKKYGLKHLVLERGKIGESWRSQRWNSFRLNYTNKLNGLPGFRVTDPDGFSTAQQYISMLEDYVGQFQLPVVENVTVLAVRHLKSAQTFYVTVKEENILKNYYCRQVIIASGTQNEIKIPSMADFIPPEIKQLHAGHYRSADQLPEGSVLVVGSAQSGCQIAEDLADNGRKVYLSTSMVARLPRSYRGKDIIDWLLALNFFEVRKEEITDPKMLHMPAPQLTGTSGLTISLQSLAKKGITLLGKLNNVFEENLSLASNAAMHVQFADAFSKNAKEMIDGFILQAALPAPSPGEDAADSPALDGSIAPSVTSLNMRDHHINTVIWATGFTNNFNYIKLPVFDADNNVIHQNGVSPIKGLYFIGLPWLTKRKSSILYGITEDAEFISEQVYHYYRSQVLQEPVMPVS